MRIIQAFLIMMATVFPFMTVAAAGDDEFSVVVFKSITELKAGRKQTCAFISHDCELCSAVDGAFVCSSVGIACVAQEWRCYQRTSRSGTGGAPTMPE